ncbi:MAG: argininosuccinate lyase, partial [Clostridiales bacterium]|nr:argininosuccinate lyase [Clostridiales bacterium]
VMKGIPLAYNKDMQEDKEPVFDAIDTVEQCVPVFAAMLDTLTIRPRDMSRAASKGFINATDCADYLTKKGMPFREAYMVVGRLVNSCIKSGDTLDTLTLRDFRAISDLFDSDIYRALELKHCVGERKVYGGPSPEDTTRQIQSVKDFVAAHRPEQAQE